MKALTYHIYLVEPVLATQPQAGEANSATSYLFIPGSMVRGALIGAYLRENATHDLVASNTEGRHLFFDGAVRYLNAYPFNVEKVARLLPKPLSWFTEKDRLEQDDATVYDLAVKEAKLDKPKPGRGVFCHVEGRIAYMGTPETQVNVHNASENRNRKDQEGSRVYRYEALAAGQTLAGVVLAEVESDLQKIKQLLETQVMFLGGSHTGGYGRVQVQQAVIGDWTGEYQPGQPDNTVIVTLLSDTILRPAGDDLALALLKTFGLDKSVISKDDYRAYFQLGIVGGFNRKWGLPLPQEWALSAGSVFRLPAGVVDMQRLQALVISGVGERRVEGFGRIAVNWQTQAVLTRASLPVTPPPLPPVLSNDSQELAQRMANRLLHNQLERQLAKAILDSQNAGFRNLPSPAQLSRVRLAARHALYSHQAAAIANHVDSLTGAKANWRETRLGREPLLDWIRQTSQLEEADFKIRFGLTSDLPSIAGVTAELMDDMRHEYCARLVDGVMKLAIEEVKRQREGR